MKKTSADYKASFVYVEIPAEEAEMRTAAVRAIIKAAVERLSIEKLSANKGAR